MTTGLLNPGSITPATLKTIIDGFTRLSAKWKEEFKAERFALSHRQINDRLILANTYYSARNYDRSWKELEHAQVSMRTILGLIAQSSPKVTTSFSGRSVSKLSSKK